MVKILKMNEVLTSALLENVEVKEQRESMRRQTFCAGI